MTKRKGIISLLSLVVLTAGLFAGTRLVQHAKDIREGSAASLPVNVSGIYPSLALFGDPVNFHPGCCNEAGIGATVYWKGKPWAISYPPTNGAVM